MFTFSFFVDLTHFFRVESKSDGKVPQGTYLLSSLQSLPDSADMGRDSASEERISGSFR